MRWTKFDRALYSVSGFALFAAVLLAAQDIPKPAQKDNLNPEIVLPDIPQPSQAIKILSDTQGIDFAPYLRGLVTKVRENWYTVIPQEAMPPLMRQGKVIVEFKIKKDGKLEGLHYVAGSGSAAMDRAGYAGVLSSAPFAPLPTAFKGDYLGLQFTFLYNPGPNGQIPSYAKDGNELVRLSEILVSTQDIPPGNDLLVAAARERAEGLLAQIRGGATFEDVARKNPDDHSAFPGANLGFFYRGQLAKSIEDAVFSLKVGDVSDVIPTKQGFVILKVTEHILPPAATPEIQSSK